MSGAGVCANCKHWFTDDKSGDGAITDPYDPDTGEPMVLPFAVNRCNSPRLLFCERPLESTGFAVADGSSYWAALYTGPDFGCVNHEAKS